MLAKLFSRKQREEILSFMLGNPSKGYRVREIAKEFKVSVGSVSQFLSILKKRRIMKRKGDTFFVNMNNPLVKAIKIVFNIEELDITPLKKIPGILGIGLYGSWANGTNKEDSDIDIWIKMKERLGQETIAMALGRLNRKSKNKVQILALDPEKKESLKKDDPIFYYVLVYGSVVLNGETLED